MTFKNWGDALPEAEVRRVVRTALAEDLPWGDVTSDNIIERGQRGTARLEARQTGVVAGLGVAARVFDEVDENLCFDQVVSDGATVAGGDVLATAKGSLRSLLHGERVALNLLQRLSGIATLTARYVSAVDGTNARIVDTRKTTPGLRLLEKYAVRMGGGQNHRFSLSDAVLIKDNHRAALRLSGKDLGAGIRALRASIPHTTMIEVEVETLGELAEALSGGANIILLDNMSIDDLRRAVQTVDGRATVEASGRITLESVRRVAETGVDIISVGALTHSAPSLDLSLEVDD